jgi:3-deoxy-D-manno-octulosonic acid kinase
VGTAARAGAFHTFASAQGTLVVDAEFEAAVRALGLPARSAVTALLASAPAGEGRARTSSVALPGRTERLHLRPVRHGGWLAPVWRGRLAGLARPIAELHVTEALRARGAPVPRAVLVAGFRAAPLWQAVLGTLEIPDARDGVVWLASGPPEPERIAVAEAAGRAVRRFHDAGGRHADLHVKNLLVREAGEPRVLVIDLDKGRAGDPPPARRRMRELMRLRRSLVKRGLIAQVGQAGERAFFRGYAGGDADLARALLARYAHERRGGELHARLYRPRPSSQPPSAAATPASRRTPRGGRPPPTA